MRRRYQIIFSFLFFLTSLSCAAETEPKIVLKDIKDISKVPNDLVCPKITDGEAAPGKRVKDYLPEYKDTKLYHAVYLPKNWQKNKKYPVIIEYAGNGYSSERSVLGYGISGGVDVICVNMPFVNKNKKSSTSSWWGDLDATLAYCKKAVPEICKKYGGDEKKVILAGFSRGSIACNYIGLHDDEIAKLWCGFICHSHYDERGWAGPQETKTQAACQQRLARLGKRPQFISHERHGTEKHRYSAINARKAYLNKHHPSGNFTFLTMSFSLHTVDWVMKDVAEREIARRWLKSVLKDIK
jgi:predicted esterase